MITPMDALLAGIFLAVSGVLTKLCWGPIVTLWAVYLAWFKQLGSVLRDALPGDRTRARRRALALTTGKDSQARQRASRGSRKIQRMRKYVRELERDTHGPVAEIVRKAEERAEKEWREDNADWIALWEDKPEKKEVQKTPKSSVDCSKCQHHLRTTDGPFVVWLDQGKTPHCGKCHQTVKQAPSSWWLHAEACSEKTPDPEPAPEPVKENQQLCAICGNRFLNDAAFQVHVALRRALGRCPMGKQLARSGMVHMGGVWRFRKPTVSKEESLRELETVKRVAEGLSPPATMYDKAVVLPGEYVMRSKLGKRLNEDLDETVQGLMAEAAASESIPRPLMIDDVEEVRDGNGKVVRPFRGSP